jgi:hypothetical protein
MFFLDSRGHLEPLCRCILVQRWIALGAILVICTLTCYINEKLFIFVYKWFGCIRKHISICVFFQNLNILCSFWSTSFFSGIFPVWSGFTFLGSTVSVTGLVLITLVSTLMFLFNP